MEESSSEEVDENGNLVRKAKLRQTQTYATTEPDKKRIRLQPANSSMAPMYFKDVVIQGVAVKIIKNIRTDCF